MTGQRKQSVCTASFPALRTYISNNTLNCFLWFSSLEKRYWFMVLQTRCNKDCIFAVHKRKLQVDYWLFFFFALTSIFGYMYNIDSLPHNCAYCKDQLWICIYTLSTKMSMLEPTVSSFPTHLSHIVPLIKTAILAAEILPTQQIIMGNSCIPQNYLHVP